VKLEGREGRRLRVGDYRVLYRVDDNQQEVLILEVWHRQSDYR
jgi:mRNA-degrading endonuclease RelE of RelBE toxin-antitoxin system